MQKELKQMLTKVIILAIIVQLITCLVYLAVSVYSNEFNYFNWIDDNKKGFIVPITALWVLSTVIIGIIIGIYYVEQKDE